MTKNGGIHPILLKMVFGLIFFILPFWGGEVGGREGGKNMANEPAVILQKGDNGKEISLKVGEVFEIQLEGVGGTGYWWYVRNLDTRYKGVKSALDSYWGFLIEIGTCPDH